MFECLTVSGIYQFYCSVQTNRTFIALSCRLTLFTVLIKPLSKMINWCNRQQWRLRIIKFPWISFTSFNWRLHPVFSFPPILCRLRPHIKTLILGYIQMISMYNNAVYNNMQKHRFWKKWRLRPFTLYNHRNLLYYMYQLIIILISVIYIYIYIIYIYYIIIIILIWKHRIVL